MRGWGVSRNRKNMLACRLTETLFPVLTRASLKEPTRPVTPVELGRQLFSSSDYQNRPSSAYGVPTRSAAVAAPRHSVASELPVAQALPFPALFTSAASSFLKGDLSSPCPSSQIATRKTRVGGSQTHRHRHTTHAHSPTLLFLKMETTPGTWVQHAEHP